jgi:poly-gamma-glutamate synthesis protein (capsule biosynthesis protein)
MDQQSLTLDRRLFLKLSGVGACDSLLGRPSAKAMSDATENRRPEVSDAITLLLCGDVMLGRGIDQILPHPSGPRRGEIGQDVRRARRASEQPDSAAGRLCVCLG